MRLGQRVRHGKFGEGVDPRTSKARAAHARVQVNFERQGTKWLMLGVRELWSTVLQSQMKIIISRRAGQVGRTAAHITSAREEANEVTVVDINDELLRDLQDRIDIRTLVGNARHPSSARKPRVRADADIFIALTNSDEVNMAGVPDRVQRCSTRTPRASRASVPRTITRHASCSRTRIARSPSTSRSARSSSSPITSCG